MSTALDHVFVCCSVGAPEAATLARQGLKEGSPNTHPGQGTASRRFFFQNAYLELLWVTDPAEAQSETVRPTMLWDRWYHRGLVACPFGIVLRPSPDAANPSPPFPTWAYRPSYLPPPIAIEIAHGTPLHEPGFFYLAFRRGPARITQEPVTHRLPISEITSVKIWAPGKHARSAAAEAVVAAGLVTLQEGDAYLMELTFDRGVNGGSVELRPTLPLLLRW